MVYENLSIREATLLIGNRVAGFLSQNDEIIKTFEESRGGVFKNKAGDVSIFNIGCCEDFNDLNPDEQYVSASGNLTMYDDDDDEFIVAFGVLLIWDRGVDNFTKVILFESTDDIDDVHWDNEYID